MGPTVVMLREAFSEESVTTKDTKQQPLDTSFDPEPRIPYHTATEKPTTHLKRRKEREVLLTEFCNTAGVNLACRTSVACLRC